MHSPGGQLLNYLQTNLSLLVGEIKLQHNKREQKMNTGPIGFVLPTLTGRWLM